MPEAPMAGQMEKPQKIGTEITVRISLTFVSVAPRPS